MKSVAGIRHLDHPYRTLTDGSVMHELSIATHLVAVATEALENAGETQPVTVVRIRVGALAGVVIEALEFAWDIATDCTRCAGARLEVERVPAAVRCAACHTETTVDGPLPFICAQCGQPAIDIVAGRELDLIALEVHDGPGPSAEECHATAHP